MLDRVRAIGEERLLATEFITPDGYMEGTSEIQPELQTTMRAKSEPGMGL